ncbi:MAG: endolytic transglycosylase MltG [Pseudomonadales bacterium]|nr:endolytic transglycosylase MltG [Pseudomonadales bacterium]
MLKKLVFLLAALAFSLVSVCFYIERVGDSPLQLDQGVSFEVTPGSTLTQVIAEMYEKGYLLQHPKLYASYAKLHKHEHIKAGEYQLDPGINFSLLLKKLNSGEAILHEIRFIEGWDFRQVSAEIRSSERFRHSITDWGVDNLKTLLGIQYDSLEGLFFPDTYHFPKTASDVDILRYSYKKMQSVLDEEWQQRGQDLPYDSPYEALIMASIVEKETGVAEERAKIAGVFVRRLKKNMRLQTDPTVIYGLGDVYQGNLTRKHLKSPSPYNTYLIKGLPPTPIAMPGREAIRAALHPEEGEALYFVAMGDGRHYFSATVEEHNKAVRKYQVKNRRADYQSTVR